MFILHAFSIQEEGIDNFTLSILSENKYRLLKTEPDDNKDKILKIEIFWMWSN